MIKSGTKINRTEKNHIRSKPWGKMARISNNILCGALVAIAAVLVFSLVFAKIAGRPPAILGYQMYIVVSGSMRPAFDAGSLVLVKPMGPEQIKSGDIITFKGFGERGALVSHRVVAVDISDEGHYHFTTQGDANDVADPNPTSAKNLVGKVVLAVPYLGILLEYAKTKRGLFLLIIIPLSALLLYELLGPCPYPKRIKTEKQAGEKGSYGNTPRSRRHLAPRKEDKVGTEN